MLKKITMFLLVFFAVNSTYANPEGGVVTAGSATISTPDVNTVQVNQASDKAIVNWQSFNIAPNETTRFVQPNSSSVILNRINPQQGASQIFGQIQANGQVILVNQAGVYFGPGSRVDVAGLIASTTDISDEKFLAGMYSFDQKSPSYNGSIINKGTLIAADHGLIALIGSAVSNEGMVQAHLGNVVLASGNKFTVGFDNSGLVNFTIDDATAQAGVDQNGVALKNGVNNSGTIIADGGTILMAAQSVSGVMDNVINMTGVVQSQSVDEHNGTIIFAGDTEGTTYLSGKVDASGLYAGQTGGVVKVLGHYIYLNDQAEINVSGDQGGGNIFIGGNYQGKGPLPNASTTYVAPDVKLFADAVTKGNGGQIITWADVATGFEGSLSAKGGVEGGNGGFAEISGKEYLNIDQLRIDLSAAQGDVGTLLLDPANITLSTAATSANVNFSGGTYTSTDNTVSNIQISGIVTQLASTNIVISATQTAGGNAGTITVANPISWSSANSLTLTAASDITLNASASIANTGSGSVNLNSGGNILIGNNATISTSASSGTGISLNATGTITTGADLTVNGGGAIDLTAGGGITLAANLATFGSNITFNSPVILGADIVLNPHGGSDIFNSTIDGAGVRSLTMSTSGSGVHEFNGDVTNVASIDITGNTNVKTANVSTVGFQGYNGDVSLNGSTDVTFTSTGGGSMVFAGSTNGPKAMIIAANSGTITLGSNNAAPLASFFSGTGNNVTVNTNNNFNVVGAITINGDLNTNFDTIISTTNSPIFVSGGQGAANHALTFSTGSGDITINNAMTGITALTFNTSGTTSLSGTVSADSVTMNGGGPLVLNQNISTTGAQVYNNLTISGPVILTSSASDITINGGVSGAGQSLTLTGGSGGNHNFSINSITGLGNLIVNGNATVTNTLSLLNGTTNTWVITNNGGASGSNGTLAAGNLTSGGVFSNIQNITTNATTNTVELGVGAGINGNIIGNSSGTNTLTIDDGNPSWVVSGNNAGSVTGVIGGFSNFENLVGSSTGTNTFAFTGNGFITGSINGGNTTQVNTMDFSAANQAMTISLSSPTSGNQFNAGQLSNGAVSSQFSNIQQAIGNSAQQNYIVLPTKNNISITYTNAAKTSGSIADPFLFTGFTIQNPPAPTPPSTVVPPDVAQIITPFTQQSTFDYGTTSSGGIASPIVEQSVDQILNQESSIDTQLASDLSVGCL